MKSTTLPIIATLHGIFVVDMDKFVKLFNIVKFSSFLPLLVFAKILNPMDDFMRIGWYDNTTRTYFRAGTTPVSSGR
ncbi:MAG: hypothetical protein FWD31_15230, partial [Planctomycetaceae bacterium]|nr:hypothetical protein [Planctomycetaceae bacterium]